MILEVLTMVEFKGDNALAVWREILAHVRDTGEKFTDRRKRTCYEVLNLTATIEDPDTVFRPLDILNKFHKWVYPDLEQIRDSMLSKGEEEYYYNYGRRIFDLRGLNQLNDYVIPLLKKTPTSKRAILDLYDAYRDSSLIKKETSGMVMMNFNIRDGKLYSTLVIRSNDMFHGWPANLLQAFYLTEYVAKELNYPIGAVSTHSISAHIFKEQLDDVGKVVGV
jgi:thymidylate synthase